MVYTVDMVNIVDMVYIVDIVHTVDMVYTVDTVDTIFAVGHFDVLFVRNKFLWPSGQFLPKACSSFLKAIVAKVLLGYLGTLSVHPVTRQIFLHNGSEVAPLAETLS